MAKTKEDIYRDKLRRLHDQLTTKGYRLQKISQACGQDDGPLVDLVTRTQAAKLMVISLREFDRINAKIPRFKAEPAGRTYYKRSDIEALASAHTVVKLRNFWDDHS